MTARDALGLYPDRMRVAAEGRGPGECWPWPGPLTEQGYPGGREYRRAWEEANGRPVAEGYTIDHRCHADDRECEGGPACPHRRCVNPDHLREVTHGENCSTENRSRKVMCRSGRHVKGQDRTRCAECRREASSERYAANRDEIAAQERARRATPEARAARRAREADPAFRAARRVQAAEYRARKRAERVGVPA